MRIYAYKNEETVLRESLTLGSGTGIVGGMPELESLARQHKALGEPSRLRIVRLLKQSSLCVCEIEAILELPQYAVSRHLSVLRQAGLVEGWREGTWMHYRLAEKLSPAWNRALEALCQVWDEDKIIQRDLRRHRKQCLQKECG